jgi:hypothetical protein
MGSMKTDRELPPDPCHTSRDESCGVRRSYWQPVTEEDL